MSTTEIDPLTLPAIRIERTSERDKKVTHGMWHVASDENQLKLAVSLFHAQSRVPGMKFSCRDESGNEFTLPKVISSEIRHEYTKNGKTDGGDWQPDSPDISARLDGIVQARGRADPGGNHQLATRVLGVFQRGGEPVRKTVKYTA